MILVWGSPADPPVAAVLDALDDLSADVEFLEDATVPALAYDLVVGPRPSGWLELGDRQVDLDEITAVYLRPGEQPRSGTPASAALLAVLGSLPATVVNRPAAGRSNLAKPFQLAALAAAGLAIPDTLVTTDPGAARDFLARHRRIVYKSISGVRSVVASINAGDPAGVERLDRLGHGPVQLQQWIDGTDVRVHVVGDRWFATSITSEATDYRYASDGTAPPELAPCDLPEDLGRRLVDVSHGMRSAGLGRRPASHRRRMLVLLRGQPVTRLHLLRGSHRSADRRCRRRPAHRPGGRRRSSTNRSDVVVRRCRAGRASNRSSIVGHVGSSRVKRGGSSRISARDREFSQRFPWSALYVEPPPQSNRRPHPCQRP